MLLAACSSEHVPLPYVNRRAYPPTGRTVTVALTARDVEWEVGPGAIYNAWTYNGTLPGPAIEATAGDDVVIQLTNPTTHPVSIHTHLADFDAANDGADPPSIARPGESITVRWRLRYAGVVPYHDHSSEAGARRGLIGAVVVHAPDEPRANEHVVVLSDLDQASFRQLPGVADPRTGVIPDAGTYRGEHQYMHVINGRAYDDAVPAFRGRVGELNRWRVVSIGVEAHTWHLHGQRWLETGGAITDNILLAPGMYNTFDMMPERPGSWMAHCHFPNHMEGGMIARFDVTQ
jgi:FtsP/CotA-like multicopper oxidase with cupredoxin domain